jgi:hypothetical protein
MNNYLPMGTKNGNSSLKDRHISRTLSHIDLNILKLTACKL